MLGLNGLPHYVVFIYYVVLCKNCIIISKMALKCLTKGELSSYEFLNVFFVLLCRGSNGRGV